jgi:threonine aldolase
MVFITPTDRDPRDLAAFLEQRGILISPGRSTRLVTHLGISTEDVTRVVEEVGAFFSK